MTDPVPSPTPTPSPEPTLAPGKPSGVKGVAKPKKITATWNAVAGATSYSVKVTGKNPKNRKITKRASSTTTTAKLKLKLKTKSKFTLCVSATNVAGTSASTCFKGKVKKK